MKNPFKKSLEVSILAKRKYPTAEETEEQRKELAKEIEGKCLLGSRKLDELVTPSVLVTRKYSQDDITMKKLKGKSPFVTHKYNRNEGIEGEERD